MLPAYMLLCCCGCVTHFNFQMIFNNYYVTKAPLGVWGVHESRNINSGKKTLQW
jgi:hypothetical protein